jgi:FkbM family methyltransferase
MGWQPIKEFIQRNLRRVGVDAGPVRLRRNVMDFVIDRDIDVVLDVGANVGQFAVSLRSNGYRGKIISFEPIGSVYQALAATARADGNWEAHNFALGATNETAIINVSDLSVFSSILTARSAATEFFDTAAVTRTEAIEVRKLDDLFPTLPGNTLLKIDTQGYERQVLEGARRALSMVKGVLLELPIIHLYEGTWQFHEALAYMAGIGFVVAQIHPVNFHQVDEMSLLEVDCLFRPRDRSVDQSSLA